MALGTTANLGCVHLVEMAYCLACLPLFCWLRSHSLGQGFSLIFLRYKRLHVSHFRSLIGGSDYKLIYRHYATLYFVFCVDSSESELGILDLIQVCVVS